MYLNDVLNKTYLRFVWIAIHKIKNESARIAVTEVMRYTQGPVEYVVDAF